jgi:bifunctional non-homologous end joining protein LigD
MKEIKERLIPLEIKQKPFSNDVEKEGKIHWVKPELVAEIRYDSFTSSGKIRKPAIFLGFRHDKKPKQVVKEVEIPADVPQKNPMARTSKKSKIPVSTDSNWPEVENGKITSRVVHKFGSHEVELRNVEKPLWRDFTKAHLVMYYHAVYPFLIKHIENRPLSLHIKHHGPNAPGLYIKDMEGRQPGWAEVFSIERKHKRKGKKSIIDYLVCNNEATLQWMINLGCIDVNPWTSVVSSPNEPDFIIIDLDPSDNDFSKAVETAMAAKQFFDKNEIKAFPKTSGKTGIHLFLPCSGFDFSQARSIAENLCKEIHSLVPSITTTSMSVSNRGDKLYLDPNQNDFADTVAAAYCLRPFHLPTISTPLEWKEVKDGLDATRFIVKSVLERLKNKGDPFLAVHDRKLGARNNKVLSKFL